MLESDDSLKRIENLESEIEKYVGMARERLEHIEYLEERLSLLERKCNKLQFILNSKEREFK